MGGGRKNLKRESSSNSEELSLQDGQTIMKVISLRGSNLVEVIDAKDRKSLALFPAKFQKSIWIKRGCFVVVDVSGMEKALESGSKVSCMVSRVLFHEQVRVLQKSADWPESFKTIVVGDSNTEQNRSIMQPNDEVLSDEEDDGLPPLEANLNRHRPQDLYAESGSDDE